MSDVKEFTLSDLSEHRTKKDLYMVIHSKVYNVSSFIDEHPGGEEVLLDVGGQDATEAFEDVGHSDEAREILDGLLVGNLKRKDGDPSPKSASQQVSEAHKNSQSSSGGIGLYAIMIIGAVIGLFAFRYFNQEEQS